MYRYIRIMGNPNKPSEIEFYDPTTDKLIGKHYIKDQSWVIAAIPWLAGTSIIVTSLSNANKAKPPNQVFGPWVLMDIDLVLILKNTSTDWQATLLPYDSWLPLYYQGINDIYMYDIDEEVKITIQRINGDEVNPIIRVCNYDLAYTKEDEDGFQEHDITQLYYRRTKPKVLRFDEDFQQVYDENDPTVKYRAYILQRRQDGSVALYTENVNGRQWNFE